MMSWRTSIWCTCRALFPPSAPSSSCMNVFHFGTSSIKLYQIVTHGQDLRASAWRAILFMVFWRTRTRYSSNFRRQRSRNYNDRRQSGWRRYIKRGFIQTKPLFGIDSFSSDTRLREKPMMDAVTALSMYICADLPAPCQRDFDHRRRGDVLKR